MLISFDHLLVLHVYGNGSHDFLLHFLLETEVRLTRL